MKRSILILAILTGAHLLKAQSSNNTNDSKKQTIELNAFNAFLGITDIKWVGPLNNKSTTPKGFAIAGLYLDYSWGKSTRPIDEYGKVKLIQAKLGYRYYLWKGAHLESTINTGYRHEEKNIYDGATLNAFSGRLYLLGGWKGDLKNNFYYRIAAGTGINLFRLGDKYAYTEKKAIPAIDITFGIKF